MKKVEFTKFYEEYANRIYRYVYLRTNNKETAEDLTSEAFLRLLESDLKEVESMPAWVFGVTRNIIKDHYKMKTKDAKASSLQINIDGEEVSQDLPDFKSEQETFDNLLLLDVKKCLMQLDALTKEVIVLKIWEDFSFKQIAELIKSKESAVKLRFYRGIEEIKVMLGERKKSKKLYAFSLPLFLKMLYALREDSSFRLEHNAYSSIKNNLNQKVNNMEKFNKLGKVSPGKLAFAGVASTAVIIAAVAIGAVVVNTTKSPASTDSASGSETVVSAPVSTPVEETPVAPAAVATESKFVGSVVEATVPAGFELKESLDKPVAIGMDTTGSTVKGLGGLEIFKDGKPLMNMGAVWGIGSSEYCTEIAKFSDTQVSYINKVVNTNKTIYGETPKVVDLTKSSYQTFTLFGEQGRIVGQNVYWNSVKSDSVFNAQCDSTKGDIKTTGSLGFTVTTKGKTDKGSMYIADSKLRSTISAEDQVKLAALLSSIKVK